MSPQYDLAVIGAGIVGLGHALAAARRGLRVVVLDRDTRANGASIRNFGFVTVTGQQAGECWRRARRSRDVWVEVAPQAGIPVTHHGLVVAARYPESEAVIDAFLNTEAGAPCRRVGPDEAREFVPCLAPDIRTALYSPVELRVESRDAIPRLTTWLAQALGVEFRFGTAARRVEGNEIVTAAGSVSARKIAVCPGDDLATLFPERLAAYGLTRCKLHMMRLMPRRATPFHAAVMSDLGLARYAGYADLPEADALKRRLDRERSGARENGVHLIVVQSQDGSLVVGDSHHYADTPDPSRRRRWTT